MKNIAKSLAKFQKLMVPIAKDRPNPFFKSKYATLDGILEAIKNPLQEAGLTFVQVPMGDTELKTVLIDVESGETIEGTMKIIPVKADPQSQGSAFTYARRYSISMMLGLSTEEDDDGNSAVSPKHSPAPSAQTSAAPSQKICVVCNKPHSGSYPKCLNCFKASSN